MTPPRIYLSPPHMSGLEQQFVQETFASNWIAPLGPQVDAFEADPSTRPSTSLRTWFAAAVGAPYALALSSGTAALHLALILASVGPGDEVLVSSLDQRQPHRLPGRPAGRSLLTASAPPGTWTPRWWSSASSARRGRASCPRP